MRQQSASSPIRVLVSDDTRFHTELLADALKRDGGLQVTTSTSGSAGLTRRSDLHNVDVLVMSSTLDEQPGHGFQVLRDLRALHSEVSAVVLLDSSNHETVLGAFAAGARGVFSRQESVERLSKCVRRVHEGQIWANSEQMKILLRALTSQDVRAVDARGLSVLSKRELEIVRSVAQGLTNREIAVQFRLSPHTVKNCLFRVFDKLGVSNRVELLLMTMNRDRDAQLAFQYLLERDGDLSQMDESTLVAGHQAAKEGIIMAQLALAQFYSANRENPSHVLNAYAWYSVTMQRLSRDWNDIAKSMPVEHVLEAEQLAAQWLNTPENAPSAPATHHTQFRKSKLAQNAMAMKDLEDLAAS